MSPELESDKELGAGGRGPDIRLDGTQGTRTRRANETGEAEQKHGEKQQTLSATFGVNLIEQINCLLLSFWAWLFEDGWKENNASNAMQKYHILKKNE